jgi:hypothetical protein
MDFQTLLIIAFILILFPLVLIVLFFLYRGTRRSEKEKQIAVETESTEPSQSQHPSELESVAHLWHDPIEGKLVVEIDEQMFGDVGDLNLDQYRRLSEISDEMHQWLGIPAPESTLGSMPGPSEKIEIRPQPADSVPDPAFSQQTAAEQGLQSQESQLSESIPKEVPGEPVRPSINPIDVFTRSLLPRSETQTPDMNVVAQINAILQENLEGTDLKQRGIRLVEQPDHSMVVMIGMEKYDSVDEVPDDEIRTVIRKAVSEWEDQMLGGES